MQSKSIEGKPVTASESQVNMVVLGNKRIIHKRINSKGSIKTNSLTPLSNCKVNNHHQLATLGSIKQENVSDVACKVINLLTNRIVEPQVKHVVNVVA